jgi:large subunit ribosomal protein L15
MTSKKRRQRGNSSHGGGSRKNRRGAGHRGGRGAAGRDKHEIHNHPPLGKSGFSRPEGAADEVATVELRSLDEDAPLLAAEDIAEETDGGYRIDARDVADDAEDADRVKVLGTGQVRHELTVVADEFSDSAREKLEAAGGETELTARAEAEEADAADDTDDQTE